VAAYPPVEPKQTHPLSVGFAMTLIAFSVQVMFHALGVPQEHGVGYWAVAALIQWGTFTLAGYGSKALIVFVLVPFLANLALWAALLPAAAIVLVRVVRRARMLAQADKAAPRRGPRPGLRAELQAWAGWSR
jgi:hypothetical protein